MHILFHLYIETLAIPVKICYNTIETVTLRHRQSKVDITLGAVFPIGISETVKGGR